MKKIAFFLESGGIYANAFFSQLLTENKDRSWKGYEFIINPEAGIFDAAFVWQSFKPLDRTYNIICPPTKTVLLCVEPPDILFLPENYTRQFYCSISQDKRVKAKVNYLSHSGHHWFAEFNIKEIRQKKEFIKSKLISVIVSDKTHTVVHKKRLELVKALKAYFGDNLDWFGRGFKELDLKYKGIIDYKYHIVLENSVCLHYWTEKIADAFVCNSYPFYVGAPNLNEYFNVNSFTMLDINNVKESIAIIEKGIQANYYENNQVAIQESRQKIIEDYHLYETCLRTLKALPNSKHEPIFIVPYSEFKYDLSSLVMTKFKNSFKNLFY